MIDENVKNRMVCEHFLFENGVGQRGESRSDLFKVEGRSLLDAPDWVLKVFATAIRNARDESSKLNAEIARTKFNSLVYDLRDPIYESQRKLTELLKMIEEKDEQ